MLSRVRYGKGGLSWCTAPKADHIQVCRQLQRVCCAQTIRKDACVLRLWDWYPKCSSCKAKILLNSFPIHTIQCSLTNQSIVRSLQSTPEYLQSTRKLQCTARALICPRCNPRDNTFVVLHPLENNVCQQDIDTTMQNQGFVDKVNQMLQTINEVNQYLKMEKLPGHDVRRLAIRNTNAYNYVCKVFTVLYVCGPLCTAILH